MILGAMRLEQGRFQMLTRVKEEPFKFSSLSLVSPTARKTIHRCIPVGRSKRIDEGPQDNSTQNHAVRYVV